MVTESGQQAAEKMNYDLIPYTNVLLFSIPGIDLAHIRSEIEF
jgi:hypothetical protein